MTPKKNSLFEELIIKSWWVIACGLICLGAYEYGKKQSDQQIAMLQGQLQEMQTQQQKALDLQAHLLRQINSQSDPNWIELVLMRSLGVVPEGQVKVFFAEQEV